MRRHMALERRLVGAEAGIAVDPVQRDARIRDQLRRETRQIHGKSRQQLHHGPVHVLLVLRLAEAEPVAVVVASERAQKRQRLAGERRPHLINLMTFDPYPLTFVPDG